MRTKITRDAREQTALPAEAAVIDQQGATGGCGKKKTKKLAYPLRQGLQFRVSAGKCAIIKTTFHSDLYIDR